MSVKESSDEFNPVINVSREQVPETRVAKSWRDFVALAVATCGVGYIPLAPGTWGSLVGILAFLGLRWFTIQLANSLPAQGPLLLISQQRFLALELLTILLVTLLGIWAASQAESLLGRKDPGKVVVDEVVGQMIALLPVSMFLVWPWKAWLIISFILFRFFDIVKPYPARRLEALHGGLGIMADDVVAGAYAAVVTSVLILGFSILFT